MIQNIQFANADIIQPNDHTSISSYANSISHGLCPGSFSRTISAATKRAKRFGQRGRIKLGRRARDEDKFRDNPLRGAWRAISSRARSKIREMPRASAGAFKCPRSHYYCAREDKARPNAETWDPSPRARFLPE